MGRGGTPAREISFVSFVAYGPNSDSALTVGVLFLGRTLCLSQGPFSFRCLRVKKMKLKLSLQHKLYLMAIDWRRESDSQINFLF